MTDETVHAGGCLCGAVRYRVEGTPESAVLCHCTMCRRASGAPAVAWITLPADRFAYVEGKAAIHASSDHGRREFCSRCGSPLVFRSSNRPAEIDVTVGTLDRPEGFRPSRHIFVASRLPWLRLDQELPEHAGFTPQEPGA